MTAVLGLAAILVWTQPQETAPPLKTPGPRQTIAGIQGFESVSTIVFPEAPEQPHRLRATYAFPDRARWQLTKGEEKRGEHEARYRYGDSFFLQREGEGRSEECSGAERDELRLELELRRALFLYPDGFDWRDSGAERRADLGNAGSLLVRAISSSDARPAEMRATTNDGRTIDVYKAITWREKDGRSRPSGLELWRLGKLVWREDITSIDFEGKVIDAFFLPVDRRNRAGSAMPLEEAKDQELPATCALRVEISKSKSWSEVVLEYRRLRDEWSARVKDRGLGMDRHATIEIDAKGEPVAWILRLDAVPENPPPEFTRMPPRRGVASAVSGYASIRPEKLASLSRALPAGTTPGIAYVRFRLEAAGDDPPDRILIVLPYSMARGG